MNDFTLKILKVSDNLFKLIAPNGSFWTFNNLKAAKKFAYQTGCLLEI